MDHCPARAAGSTGGGVPPAAQHRPPPSLKAIQFRSPLIKKDGAEKMVQRKHLFSTELNLPGSRVRRLQALGEASGLWEEDSPVRLPDGLERSLLSRAKRWVPSQSCADPGSPLTPLVDGLARPVRGRSSWRPR